VASPSRAGPRHRRDLGASSTRVPTGGTAGGLRRLDRAVAGRATGVPARVDQACPYGAGARTLCCVPPVAPDGRPGAATGSAVPDRRRLERLERWSSSCGHQPPRHRRPATLPVRGRARQRSPREARAAARAGRAASRRPAPVRRHPARPAPPRRALSALRRPARILDARYSGFDQPRR
jgi:hypothetical protein